MKNADTRIRGNQGISVARHDGRVRALKRIPVFAEQYGIANAATGAFTVYGAVLPDAAAALPIPVS